jgi:hypothetical protein
MTNSSKSQQIHTARAQSCRVKSGEDKTRKYGNDQIVKGLINYAIKTG